MNDHTPPQAPVLGGRYEVGPLLGRGGMAEVRKGNDLRLGRVVAIKRLRTDLASDPTFQARFRREAQSAASLNHPAVVSVYDTGEELSADGTHPQPFIVMEYVAGRTLRDIMREGRRILPERALEITASVLGALDYSHRAGIVHRDIKPANVMLTPSGDVKVMDFGIARAVADAASNITQTAAVLGTAQYLSPEQARGETVDVRSDVYSTGCMLYELLTGRPPFLGETPVSIAYQHVREQPDPPSVHDPTLPAAVDAIVLKALAKRTEDRYQSAAAMKADIERYLAGQPVSATPPPAVLGDAEPTSLFAGTVTEEEEPRRRRWPLVLLAVLLLAVLGAAVAVGMNLFDPPAEQVSVPSVVNLTLRDAERRLEEEGLRLGSVERETSDSVETNRVLSQDPGRGVLLAPDSEVDLVISAGTGTVVVPLLIGETRAAAQDALTALGLDVRFEADAESDQPRNTVTATDPGAAQSVPVGSTVMVFVSAGPVEVPSVVGLEEAQASRILDDAGFEVAVVDDDTTPAVNGQVLAQDPPALSEEPRGSVVTITVSRYVEPTPSEPTEESPSDPTEPASPSGTASEPTTDPSESQDEDDGG